MFFEIVEKCAFFHKFEQKIKVLAVIKNGINSCYVFMVAKTLYFNLQC